MVESLFAKEIVEYPNGGRSYFYIIDQMVIIVDEGICKYESEEDKISYSLITDKQNYYMHRYEKVFRFLAEDMDKIEESVKISKKAELTSPSINQTVEIQPQEEPIDTTPFIVGGLGIIILGALILKKIKK